MFSADKVFQCCKTRIEEDKSTEGSEDPNSTPGTYEIVSFSAQLTVAHTLLSVNCVPRVRGTLRRSISSSLIDHYTENTQRHCLTILRGWCEIRGDKYAELKHTTIMLQYTLLIRTTGFYMLKTVGKTTKQYMLDQEKSKIFFVKLTQNSVRQQL